MRTSDTAHCIRAAVLFVIGMQDIENRQRTFKHRIWFVLQLRRLEHHVEEISFVTQIVIRIRILHTNTVAKRESSNGGYLGNQTIDLLPTTLFIKNIFSVRIESRQSAERRFKHSH